MPALTLAAAADADADAWQIAMLGDSDSHSFHDRIWTPEGRGGPFAAGTFQWGEVLVRLRGAQLDAGPWGVWGTRKKVVQVADWFGIAARAPRKEDYRNNFAVAGARCADLNEGTFRQAPRLLALMDSEPDRWRHAVVVIRIGINGIGWSDNLDRLAADPAASASRALSDGCVRQIGTAVATIQRAHPQTRFVLVGILNNADWPPYFERWRTARDMANIDAGLDAFDNALRAMAARDPRIAFFDDRAWFARRWGRRGPNGAPDYRVVRVDDALQVTLTQGDDPKNAVLGDGHAGVVWNALWAQSLVALLRTAFGVPVPQVEDREVAALVGQARLLARPAGGTPQSQPGGTR